MAETAVRSARFTLRGHPRPTTGIEPTAEQQQVIGFAGRRLKVLAGPGTGKSSTLVEAVAQRISIRGVEPESILVLTFSRRAAAELTGRITRRLGITTREPMVRTLHGYAFSLLRAEAVRSGEPSPRLMGAGESDQMVRELLAGQRDSGRGGWPATVSAALDSPAFAAELRDLMLRTAERGITPRRLADLGRRRQRPEWQAAAQFAREYQDVSDLRQGSSGLGAALDQAELTRAALGLLGDDHLLAAEQSRIRRIFVDEYQDVDPSQARLIELLASGADELMVFGDPDQSIYAFRGSDPAALRDIEVDRTLSLTVSRRLAPAILTATRNVAARLPGSFPHRALVSGPAVTHRGPRWGAGSDSAADGVRSPLPVAGEVVVRTLPTAAREAAFVADELRRAHLRAAVPWSQMAVLVRSPTAALPALRRAFSAAGVPLTVAAQDTELVADPVVAVLLTVLRCGQEPALLNGQVALELLSSPAVGMDSDALRRLRRKVRAAQPDAGATPDLLAAALAGSPMPEGLPADLSRPVHRVRAMLDAARAGAADPDAESSLWQVWRLAGLEDNLVTASLHGGRSGQRADSTLDAVMALFSMAADLADRMPLAGVGAFLDVVDGQRIPRDPTAGTVRSADAVAVLSAHAAKGLEWDVVCLAGVNEGRWPVLRTRPSLLGTEEVLDAAAGLPPAALDSTAAMQEERRLFYVAATRARTRLIATAVLDQDTVPSRFLYELTGSDDELASDWPKEQDGTGRRGLHLADLVAELRRVVTDPTVPEHSSRAAATQLARLAAAGVVGAHPRDWYGVAQRSTSAPAVPDGARVTVSPSAVESLARCALRGVLERRGASGTSSQQQIEGIVVHALVDGLARGVDRGELVTEMERFLAQQTHVPPWLLARTRRALEAMLTAAQTWMAQHTERTLVGSEVRLSVAVPPVAGEPRTREVRLEGRADRLDRVADGSLVVVDFKTGATVPSKASVAENVQLAVYQLAIELGAADGIGSTSAPRPALTAPASSTRSHGPQGTEDRIRPLLDEPLPDEPLPAELRTGGPLPGGRGGRLPGGPLPDEPLPEEPPPDEMLDEQQDLDQDGDPHPAERSGGAELIYLRSGSPNVREQGPLDRQGALAWRATVRGAAERLAASVSLAQENRYCERCPVRSSCPLQPEGRQVTR